jgi:ubiquinone/menaquinone biosynthesis C-methylase UbiE
MVAAPLDADCLRYLRHWEPVLSGPSRRTLERLDAAPAVLLDLGAGTGSLTLAAAERWPSVRVRALDASGAMLDVARSRMAGADDERVSWLPADAAHIPLDDASVDAVVSSFVLQLVDDRPMVLAEVRRVLRPAGSFSFVTWLAGELALPADAAYHEIVGDLGGDDIEEDSCSSRSGEYRSLEQVQHELEEAGFAAVEVVSDELRHVWTATSYLEFKEGYDDVERLETLDEAQREQLHEALVERLVQLPPEAFEVRGPLVLAVARRPDD